MANALCDAGKNLGGDAVFRDGMTTLYLALFTGDPLTDGTGPEASGGGYARQVVTFGAPATPGIYLTDADVVFPSFTSDVSGPATWVAVFDDPTAGTIRSRAPLTVAKAMDMDVEFDVPAGNVEFDID
jgi:hypothetical protein